MGWTCRNSHDDVPAHHQESASVEKNDEGHDEDFSALFSNNKATDSGVAASIPIPKPPEEHEPVPGTRFLYVKKFGEDVNDLRLESLTPDRFYNVQVLCETTGGQLGTWSMSFIFEPTKIRVTGTLS